MMLLLCPAHPCSYRGYIEDGYNATTNMTMSVRGVRYWQVQTARLAFVIVFEVRRLNVDCCAMKYLSLSLSLSFPVSFFLSSPFSALISPFLFFPSSLHMNHLFVLSQSSMLSSSLLLLLHSLSRMCLKV